MTFTMTKENPLYYTTTITIPGLFLYHDSLKEMVIVTPVFKFGINKAGMHLYIGFCKV